MGRTFRSVDRNSPSFKVANTACASLRPRFGRGGGGGVALVPRPSGLREGFAANGRWRRVGGAAVPVAAVVIVIGVGLPGSSHGAGQPAKSSVAATVQRRDLVATDTESGTLSYADPQTVFNRLSGTITALPAVGQLIKAGQTLYQVNGSPVMLFDGTVPAYRDLTLRGE